MRMIRCNTCGTLVASDDTTFERLLDEAREERNLAQKEEAEAQKLIARANFLSQSAKIRLENAKQLDKMANQVQHRYAQMEERGRVKNAMFVELMHFVIDNGYMTPEQINELEKQMKHNCALSQKEEEKVIRKIYEAADNYMVNKTKGDPTAGKAIRNVLEELRTDK